MLILSHNSWIAQLNQQHKNIALKKVDDCSFMSERYVKVNQFHKIDSNSYYNYTARMTTKQT